MRTIKLMPIILINDQTHVKIKMPIASWLIRKHKNKHKPFHEILAVVFAIVILYFLTFTILIVW